MKLCWRKPAPPLAVFVNRFWFFESGGPAKAKEALPEKERALPDGCAQLIVNLSEDQHRIYDRRNFQLRGTTNGCLIVGPQSEFCVIDRVELMVLAGVHFKPGGAYPFLEPPTDEIHGLHVPLDVMWGNFASELRERLLEAVTIDERFRIMEEALLARARRGLARHPAVAFAIQQFQSGPRAPAIAEVTEQTGLSARRFIDVFRQEVGLTPKLFCRVRRFQQALRQVAAGRRVEWADVALDAGYFDQAHFIHDFRAFSGINPSTYRDAQPRHPNHVPLHE